jgi:hypothetical protein
MRRIWKRSVVILLIAHLATGPAFLPILATAPPEENWQLSVYPQFNASLWPSNILVPQGVTGGELFGWSVTAFAGIVLVGAPCSDLGAEDAGASYLFNATAGSLLRTLQNPSPEGNDHSDLPFP